MPRLPFDPKKAAGAQPAAGRTSARREKRAGRRVDEASQLTVSQLAALIKSTLEERITSPLRVIGEVSNLKTPNHWYFSLKDDAAVISCVAWRSSAGKFGFTPKEGDEVVATGHVSHYGPQGKTQLYVTKLEPVGAGALEMQFRAMCEELRGLGYFDPSRKKPLPVFPRRVAIITSKTGAAIHDVINTAAQRCRAVGMLLIPVRVQGDGAKDDVARAIKWVDAHHERLGIDAVLVTRGGGSMEDLWAFNERIVADAAFQCSIPLIAAIGHESDTTVIELVADHRSSTPTQAAMRLVPDASEMHKQLDHLAHRLTFVTRRRVERERQRLESHARHEMLRDPRSLVQRERDRLRSAKRDLKRIVRWRIDSGRARLERLAGRLGVLKPHAIVAQRQARLAVMEDRLHRAVKRHILDQGPKVDQLAEMLNSAMERRIRIGRDRLTARERELIAVDPRQVLKRGYSYSTLSDGTLLRSIRDAETGRTLHTHLVDGVIESTIGGSRGRRPRQRRTSTTSESDEQMDLFSDTE